jgi:hypothetical protein
MRKSRVLLAGAAVAAAAVTTSAFTAGNDVPDSVAGYGEGTVTGAEINSISYTRNATDGTIVDAVVFESYTDITNSTSTMTLKSTGGTVVVDTYGCTVTTPWDSGATPPFLILTCDTTAASNGGVATNFADFDTVGLTVVD